jgi:hypothetical protein
LYSDESTGLNTMPVITPESLRAYLTADPQFRQLANAIVGTLRKQGVDDSKLYGAVKGLFFTTVNGKDPELVGLTKQIQEIKSRIEQNDKANHPRIDRHGNEGTDGKMGIQDSHGDVFASAVLKVAFDTAEQAGASEIVASRRFSSQMVYQPYK